MLSAFAQVSPGNGQSRPTPLWFRLSPRSSRAIETGDDWSALYAPAIPVGCLRRCCRLARARRERLRPAAAGSVQVEAPSTLCRHVRRLRGRSRASAPRSLGDRQPQPPPRGGGGGDVRRPVDRARPVYRVVVRFTRAPEETLRRYTGNPLFVAGSAPVSRKALLLDHERAMAALRPTGLRYASRPDMLTGLIEIVAEHPEAVERLRAAGKVDLPSNTVIKKAAGPFPESPPPH